jgi:hypothetical protein
VFITNAEKAKLWDNISVLLKKDNSRSAEITALIQQLKRLESKLTVLSVNNLLNTTKPVKKKTPEQLQKLKDKQREYNKRWYAKKRFEKLEREMAARAEQTQ